MAYTFLNLTDKPSLNAPDSKLMRAHVTRSNFAQRRQQIAKRILEEKRSERHILHSREGREFIPHNALNPDRSVHFGTDIYTDGLMLTTPTDPNISAKSCASCNEEPYDPSFKFPHCILTVSSTPRVPPSDLPCRRHKCQRVQRGSLGRPNAL